MLLPALQFGHARDAVPSHKVRSEASPVVLASSIIHTGLRWAQVLGFTTVSTAEGKSEYIALRGSGHGGLCTATDPHPTSDTRVGGEEPQDALAIIPRSLSLQVLWGQWEPRKVSEQ